MKKFSIGGIIAIVAVLVVTAISLMMPVNATTHTHVYEHIKRVAPTCTTQGYNIHECECGSMIRTTLSATGHTTKTTYKVPTCTSGGYKKTICTKCNKTLSFTSVPSKGHTKRTYYKAPTCTSAGWTKVVCSTCSKTLSYSTHRANANNHGWKTISTLNNGLLWQRCLYCGNTRVIAK